LSAAIELTAAITAASAEMSHLLDVGHEGSSGSTHSTQGSPHGCCQVRWYFEVSAHERFAAPRDGVRVKSRA
jgi:hypothetical protein